MMLDSSRGYRDWGILRIWHGDVVAGALRMAESRTLRRLE